MIINTFIDVLFVEWGVIAVLSTLSAWRYTWGLPLSEIPGVTPPVGVIVAVKNASEVSRAFFGRLRHQAYPDYRIIAADNGGIETAGRAPQSAFGEPSG